VFLGSSSSQECVPMGVYKKATSEDNQISNNSTISCSKYTDIISSKLICICLVKYY